MPPEQTEKQRETFQKWLEALRSGKYLQGTGYLCHQEKYCCLGVLADVAGISRTAMKNHKDSPPLPMMFHFPAGGQAYTIMPPEAYNQLTGRLGSEVHILASINDDQRLTFSEIADLLERAEAKNTYLAFNAELP